MSYQSLLSDYGVKITRRGWIALTPEEEEEFIKTELKKYEAFDRKYELGFTITPEKFNRPITI
ncbi:MAG: hypothetical protein ACE5J4_03370 [Candidatus Aenigmatarchaeota archaeon]